MSVVGRLKEELSGVGLKVWTMCLRCSWSTSIRDTCTMEERECVCVCVCVCARVCMCMCGIHVVVYVCTWLHGCVRIPTLYSNGHFKRGSNSPLMRTKKTEK